MKMKQNVIGLVIAGLVLTTGAGAFAANTPSPAPSGLERVRAKVQERNQEREQKLKEKAQNQRERMGTFWEKMQRRLERLIKNQKDLADRIGKRLDKAAENGKDVTALRAKLNDARVLIANAETELASATQKVKDLVASGADPKEILKQVRELNQKVLKAIRAAHEALVDIIVNTKGLGGRPTPTP